MKDSPNPSVVNPDDSTFIATLTVAQLKSVIASVVATAKPVGPQYLDESELFERFGLKKASADAAGIPRKRVGRKSKWLLTDVEKIIAAKPVVARPPRKSRPIADDADPIDAMLAAGEVVARKGAR